MGVGGQTSIRGLKRKKIKKKKGRKRGGDVLDQRTMIFTAVLAEVCCMSRVG